MNRIHPDVEVRRVPGVEVDEVDEVIIDRIRTLHIEAMDGDRKGRPTSHYLIAYLEDGTRIDISWKGGRIMKVETAGQVPVAKLERKS